MLVTITGSVYRSGGKMSSAAYDYQYMPAYLQIIHEIETENLLKLTKKFDKKISIRY